MELDIYAEYYDGQKIGESHEEARAWCETHCKRCHRPIEQRDDGMWCDQGTEWLTYCTGPYCQGVSLNGIYHAPVAVPRFVRAH